MRKHIFNTERSMHCRVYRLNDWSGFLLLTAAMQHGVDEPMALLRLNGNLGCLKISLHLICNVGPGVSHLLNNSSQVLHGV